MSIFISDYKKPECDTCGNEYFERKREAEEKECLSFNTWEGESSVDIDDSEMNIVGEWVYECCGCGSQSTDIDDLLADKEDEDELGD